MRPKFGSGDGVADSSARRLGKAAAYAYLRSRTSSRQIPLLITRFSPTEIRFSRADQRFPERFTLLKDPEKGWILRRTTPEKPLPYTKTHFVSMPAEKVEQAIDLLRNGGTAQAKIDGASTLIQLLRDGVEVYSYRRSSKTGRPIVHTERFFGGDIPSLKIPEHLVGTVLRGEIYGVRRLPSGRERVIPPQELGAILNAGLQKALERQRRRNIELREGLFDIEQLGSKPIDFQNTPYSERYRLLREIAGILPSRFHPMESVSTPEEARELWKRVSSGKHPLTREGIVIRPPEGKPVKVKLREERDVYIRGVFPGEGKYRDNGIGGFTYSFEPDGPIIGRIGTGISDELRRDAWRNPEAYIGRVARVISQGSYPSGALRAPALLALHEDYPLAVEDGVESASERFR